MPPRTRTPSSPPALADGPLAGLRVLEASTGRPARIAGMLLADLGASVVRAVGPAATVKPLTPEALCWDRGKRIMELPPDAVPAAADRADVLLVDGGPTRLLELGWDHETISRGRPDLTHVWLPPYGCQGEWAELPEDPLLLAALTGLAVYYPADDDSPVAPVGPVLTYLHAAAGAAATVASVIGRHRHGIARPAVVTGLHAAAVLLGPAYTEFNEATPFSSARDSKGAPNWRLYECSDGKWLFLAALTPEIFIRALDVLDCVDLMALPEVGGDFMNVLNPARGKPVVNAALEPVFASRPSSHWLQQLQAGRVPCAVAQSRSEWFDGPVVRANGTRRRMTHPETGTVTLPDVPVTFSRTPACLRGFAEPGPVGDPWPARGNGTPSSGPNPATLPLADLRVIDGATFQAAPTISSLLADYGADVVRVEAPAGDPYRTYSLSFLAVNQRKRGVVLDLKQPGDLARMHQLLASADAYVENLPPHGRARLELNDDGPAPRFPGLVHCSLSAFGQAEEFAGLPGFDPVFQTLSGLAAAQGGSGAPVVTPAPLNDAAAGALGALGTLAALYRRLSDGQGQRVLVSLAAAATFLQSGEFTSWPGAPRPQGRGGALYRGPGPGNRYYQCRDGWIAVAALDPEQRARLAAAVGVDDLADASAALSGRTVRSATSLLNDSGVPVCRVTPRLLPLRDQFLVDNAYSHTVPIADGIARVAARYSYWPGAAEPRPSRFFEPGEDTAEVFAELDATG